MVQLRELAEPTVPTPESPLRLATTLFPPSSQEEINQAWPRRTLPVDLNEFWRLSAGGRLFVDVDYGQWGLVIYGPAKSVEMTATIRSEDDRYEADDLIVGEFLGDTDRLVIQTRPDGGSRVLIALALDDRIDWDEPAHSFEEFLTMFVRTGGKKYWEPNQ